MLIGKCNYQKCALFSLLNYGLDSQPILFIGWLWPCPCSKQEKWPFKVVRWDKAACRYYFSKEVSCHYGPLGTVMLFCAILNLMWRRLGVTLRNSIKGSWQCGKVREDSVVTTKISQWTEPLFSFIENTNFSIIRKIIWPIRKSKFFPIQ